MNVELVQGILLVGMVAVSLISAIRGSEKNHARMKQHLSHPTDEDVVVGDLGPAVPGDTSTIDAPEIGVKVSAGFAGIDIKKNAQGLIEAIQGVPLAVVPNATIGKMTEAVRGWCTNAGHKMSRDAAMKIADRIKQVYQSGKAAPAEPANDDGKGKANINAA